MLIILKPPSVTKYVFMNILLLYITITLGYDSKTQLKPTPRQNLKIEEVIFLINF